MHDFESLFGPPISQKLIDELRDAFPTHQVGPDDDIAHIMFYAGQQSIIDYLKTRLEQEN